MDAWKKAALLQKWKEFWDSMPDERVIRKGGIYGEDIVLPKQINNGVLGYLGPLDVPLWGQE